MSVKNIFGDLLKIKGEFTYIIQQCNCLCVHPHGLAEDIANAFPYANVYGKRKQMGRRNLAYPEYRDTPGTFRTYFGSKLNDPTIVALFAQYDFGKSGRDYGNRPKDYDDSNENREKWFKSSLFSFGEHVENMGLDKEKVTIYFPFKIGCGLAGGDWSHYKPMIEEFSKKFGLNVFIVNNM
jgi:hypothetical protein